MSHFPWEVEREILLRLPAEFLFRFRTVCKSWLRIIDDPSFVRSHITNHRPSPILLIKNYNGTLYSLSLDSLNYDANEQSIHATHVNNLNVPRIRSLAVASCNGLLLVSHYLANKTWAICNPLTGDSHELPLPDVNLPYLIGVGLGYDSRSDDHKVVRISSTHREDEAARTLIYSLKSRSWRMTTSFFPPCFMFMRRQGVYLNGAVHWISSRGTVVALDLATEEYRELQPPPPPQPPMCWWHLEVRLEALDGCLVWSDENVGWAWTMRGYGTEEAIWVELFTAEERRSVISGLGSTWRMWPIAFSKAKAAFVQHNNKIIRWDIETLCEECYR